MNTTRQLAYTRSRHREALDRMEALDDPAMLPVVASYECRYVQQAIHAACRRVITADRVQVRDTPQGPEIAVQLSPAEWRQWSTNHEAYMELETKLSWTHGVNITQA